MDSSGDRRSPAIVRCNLFFFFELVEIRCLLRCRENDFLLCRLHFRLQGIIECSEEARSFSTADNFGSLAISPGQKIEILTEASETSSVDDLQPGRNSWTPGKRLPNSTGGKCKAHRCERGLSVLCP
ncbi:hypothetical protein MPTK1_7g11250 [Marchantia polymorpha subsp. ruderalis]|uniref:Uncharacterized protein n=2 Tax=Marchantia polymorpha TaxID=3197 RepID=A0AAF6BYD0_MARPO|nr:hypothetical protein MARPO_0003s0139 [Marchantia polymorpha]BBN17014.1 hypothetical protein Mp_7g11250 [Marchantia polymorpha subsp. ruderalis]|eukprot:PTQ49251.1 hypothetical protein MARPO_0003s0139 [Marchantia polymorpha]